MRISLGRRYMKKLLIFVIAASLGIACSSKSSQTRTTADGRAVLANAQDAQNAKNAKYQIVDQEFDNLLAPEADYETLHDYELQACGDSYLPPANLEKKAVKPGKKMAGAAGVAADASKNTNVKKSKKVVNTTNIYYIDGPAPAPTHITNTTSTVTTYSNSTGSSTSTSASSGSSF